MYHIPHRLAGRSQDVHRGLWDKRHTSERTGKIRSRSHSRDTYEATAAEKIICTNSKNEIGVMWCK